MICPNCNTENDPANQFCEKCGKPLHLTPKATTDTNKARDYLIAHTFKLVIALIGLWVIKTILVDLIFVKELSIPKLPIPVTALVNLIVMIFVFFLLLAFTKTVVSVWPIAFPMIREAGSVWSAILIIFLLGLAYRIFKPIVLELSPDYEPMMILQLALLLIAFIVVFRAGLMIYHAIPVWYVRIKEDWSNIGKNISN